MKAYKLTALIILMNCGWVSAQDQITPDNRATAVETVYELVQKYQKNCSFTELTGHSISAAYVQAYTSLFDSSARVYDETDLGNRETNDYGSLQKPLADYIAGIKTNFPAGLNVKVTKATINFDSIANRLVYVYLAKEIKATDKDGHNVVVNDTVQLNVHLNSDLTTASIIGLAGIGNNMACANCPKVSKKPPVPAVAAQDKTANNPAPTASVVEKPVKAPKPAPAPVEKPSKKPKPIPVEIVGNAGKPVKTKEPKPVKEKTAKTKPYFALCVNLDAPLTSMKLPALTSSDLGKLNYTGLNKTNANLTNFTSGSVGGSVAASVMGDIVIPTKKSIALSIGVGLMYNLSTTKAHADSLYLEYQSQDKEGNAFTRVLTGNNITEKIKSNNIAVPLLLKIQTDTSKKIGFFVQAGPVFMDYNSVTSNYNGTLNYGAIYQINGTKWVVTEDYLIRNHTQAELNAHYQTLSNVAFEQSVSGKSNKFSFHPGIGGIFRTGVAINTAQKLSWLIGVELMYAKVSGNSQANATLSEPPGTANTYNSLLYAANSYSIFNYGITLGLQYKFISLRH